MKVRTRFAPSPTGNPHIGHLRTAVYAYVLAKHNKGDFLLRIEDTDQKRLVANSVEKIKETLTTFGLRWDEFYIQSERLSIYQKAAEKLVASGHAYYSDGAVKLKVPKNKIISYHDFVFQEEIKWHSDDVFEAVLLKSDGFPTYHLAAVVDDHAMAITHVLRGYDWMPSTPLHLLIYKFLNYEVPEIGHLTDIQSPEGGKLSKRKGSTSIEQFLKDGYLPAALLNFVILMGWAPKDNRELFTLDEFVQNFDPNGFQKSNPVFNITKLNWFNQQYIKKLGSEELGRKIERLTKRKDFEKLIPLVRDRLVTLKDFDNLTEYFFKRPKVAPQNKLIIDHAISVLEKDFDGKILETKARAFCAQQNIKVGDYFMALRLAITGRSATPPLWEVMEILGEEESLERLKLSL
ncbi:glutamate--tRNA ligase [Candidatus Gottesmanbacteria bacterium]|nr:glutamate--tRNA ligase [Candidatus Gottesmanbacteria bacterium]